MAQRAKATNGRLLTHYEPGRGALHGDGVPDQYDNWRIGARWAATDRRPATFRSRRRHHVYRSAVTSGSISWLAPDGELRRPSQLKQVLQV